MNASIVRRYVLDIERVRRAIRRFVVPASYPIPLPLQRTASAPSNSGTASNSLVEVGTNCRFFVQNALICSAGESRDGLRMKRNQTTHFGGAAAQFFLGSVALAVVTLAFIRLHVDLATTAFADLIVILLFSLMGSFTASALLSIVVGCRPGLLLCSANLPIQDRRTASCRGAGRLLLYLVDRDALDPECPQGKGGGAAGRSEAPAQPGRLARQRKGMAGGLRAQPGHVLHGRCGRDRTQCE